MTILNTTILVAIAAITFYAIWTVIGPIVTHVLGLRLRRKLVRVAEGQAYCLAGEISPEDWSIMTAFVRNNANLKTLNVIAGPWMLVDSVGEDLLKWNPEAGREGKFVPDSEESLWQLHPLFREVRKEFPQDDPAKDPTDNKIRVWIKAEALPCERHFFVADKPDTVYIEYYHGRGKFQGGKIHRDLKVVWAKRKDWLAIRDGGLCTELTPGNVQKLLRTDTIEFSPMSGRPPVFFDLPPEEIDGSWTGNHVATS